jgi:hypothetical protein
MFRTVFLIFHIHLLALYFGRYQLGSDTLSVYLAAASQERHGGDGGDDNSSSSAGKESIECSADTYVGGEAAAEEAAAKKARSPHPPVYLTDPRNAFQLLDTGYYLGLDVKVPDDTVTDPSAHSDVYRSCAQACQRILELYGIGCGQRMLRKLTSRNITSHGTAYALQKLPAGTNTATTSNNNSNVTTTTAAITTAAATAAASGCGSAETAAAPIGVDPSVNRFALTRSSAKLAMGWTRFHVTLLSPAEYARLRASGEYEMFLRLLTHTVDFAPLMRSFARQAGTGVGTGTGTAGAGLDIPGGKVGFLRGAVAPSSSSSDASGGSGSMVFNLDDAGAQAGLSAKGYSTAVYLLLDAANPTLREVSDLRQRFAMTGCTVTVPAAAAAAAASVPVPAPVLAASGDDAVHAPALVAPSSEADGKAEEVAETVTAACWIPHITLGFTHNDVRAVEGDPGTWDKQRGVTQFAALYASLCSTSATSSSISGSSSSVTDLQEDHLDAAPCTTTAAASPSSAATPSCSPSLAMLLLYSEAQCTVRAGVQHRFLLADLKARKGVMGDDATYRAHPFLQAHLPRGMVYLQHAVTRRIYRGLFSLQKFYGKEGIEDDGIGISANQLNFKLGRILDKTSKVLVMEKVNGRAASCRFFQYADQLLVIVGTKLAHMVCLVDSAAQRLVQPLQEGPAAATASAAAVEREGEEEDEEEEDADDEPRAGIKNGEAEAAPSNSGDAVQATGPASDANFTANLITSNVRALEGTLRWDRLAEFVTWLAGRTLNGEVLDPMEMHLVTIVSHEWVSLCVTDFPAAVAAPTLASYSSSVSTAPSSAVQNMEKLGHFTLHIPACDLYDMNAPQNYDTDMPLLPSSPPAPQPPAVPSLQRTPSAVIQDVFSSLAVAVTAGVSAGVRSAKRSWDEVYSAAVGAAAPLGSDSASGSDSGSGSGSGTASSDTTDAAAAAGTGASGSSGSAGASTATHSSSLSAGAGAGATATRATKRQLLTEITNTLIFARDSEGKVLYFLDGADRVLELMKYKTWWYIWRRSIREITSQVFHRYYRTNKSISGGGSKRDNSAAAERQKVEETTAKVQGIIDQMNRASAESKSNEKFTTKMTGLLAQIQSAHEHLRLLDEREQGNENYDVSFVVKELSDRINQKWLTKFSFFQAELGPRYDEIVLKVMDIAIQYLHWVELQFGKHKDQFYFEVKQSFPVVWDRFLAECSLGDQF